MPFMITVIGCGWVSMECHGPAYVEYARSHPDVLLAACCDVDPQRSEEFRVRFSFRRAYRDYLDMLENEQPQAVALNVPPQAMCLLGCDILRRGYPLICEKPPGLSLAEIDQLIEAAQSSGTPHMVAFNRRYMPLAVELKRQLSGQKIHHLEAQQARVLRMDVNFATTAIHLIDAARFLAGSDYAQFNIHYQELPGLGPGVANYLLNGRFASGATVHLAITPVAGLNIERTIVYALDHTFLLQANNGPDAPGHLWHYSQGQLVTDLNAERFTGRSERYFLDGFYPEDAAFFDAIRAGRRPDPDFYSCHQSVEIMECLSQRRTGYP